MRAFFLILCVVLSAFSSESEKQTLLITLDADSSGPIFLPKQFISEESIEIRNNSTFELPPWYYSSGFNALYFEQSIPSQTTLEIHYLTKYGTLNKQFLQYEPVLFDTTRIEEANTSSTTTVQNRGQYSDIKISGEKGIGVKVGTGGGFTMDQSLDVSLFGLISDSTLLSANISDQSTSLEGDTKEVGELDKIFLTVENPKWSITVGDIAVQSSENGILNYNNFSKGVLGALVRPHGEVHGYGAISGNRFAIDVFSGISGIQSGAYVLDGNGEVGTIIPIEGTVVVTVDGATLTEGKNSDYTIDYGSGNISFTPGFAIQDDQLIEVRYRYRTYDYTKILTGGGVDIYNHDSSLAITSSIHVENDNYKNSELAFTGKEIASLVESGDIPPAILSGRKVHPNDVPKESVRSWLYELDTNSQVYRFVPIPQEIYLNRDLYLVEFSPSDTGGEYLHFRDSLRNNFTNYSAAFLDSVSQLMADTTFKGDIYLCVENGKGTHTAYYSAPLPEQDISGEVVISYEPSEQFSISSTIAGNLTDKNRYSSQDDEDNSSSAVISDISISTPVDNSVVFSTLLHGTYAGKRFSTLVSDRYRRQQSFGLLIDSTRFSLYKVTSSLRVMNQFTIGGGTGISFVDNSPYSNMFSTNSEYKNSRLRSYYELNRIYTYEDHKELHRNQQVKQEFFFPVVELDFGVSEMWGRDSTFFKKGNISSNASASLFDRRWTNSFEYKEYRKGEDLHFQNAPYRKTIQWNQNASFDIQEIHSLLFRSNLLHQIDSTRFNTLLFQGEKESRYTEGRFVTNTSLTINSENSSAKRWEYIYVGEGIGSHIKDSLTGEFIPSPYGDYEARERDLLSTITSKSISNTLTYQWQYRSRESYDTRFELSGLLSNEEAVLPEKITYQSGWIPLIPTFYPNENDSVSNSSQRLMVNSTAEFPALANTILRQSFELGRTKRDLNNTKNMETSSEVEKDFYRTGSTLGFSSINEIRNVTTLKDYSTFWEQRLLFRKKTVVPYVKSLWGYLELNSTSGDYITGSVGLRFRDISFGTIQAAYTAADVRFNGPLYYPMADNYKRGINHRFTLNALASSSRKVIINGLVRVDYSKEKEWKTVLSMRATIKL